MLSLLFAHIPNEPSPRQRYVWFRDMPAKPPRLFAILPGVGPGRGASRRQSTNLNTKVRDYRLKSSYLQAHSRPVPTENIVRQ